MSDRKIRQVTNKVLNLKNKVIQFIMLIMLISAIQWPESYDSVRFYKKDRDYTKHLRLVPCYHGKLKYQIDADGRVGPMLGTQ